MSGSKVIDLMAALKESLAVTCACGHPYSEHRGPHPSRCSQADCGCAGFLRAPEPKEEDDG